jgi:hypothetical protein
MWMVFESFVNKRWSGKALLPKGGGMERIAARHQRAL